MKLTKEQLDDIVSKYPRQANWMIRAKDVPHLFDPEHCNGLYDVEEIESLEYNHHLTDEELQEAYSSYTPEEQEEMMNEFKNAEVSHCTREERQKEVEENQKKQEEKKAISIRLQTKTINLLKQQAKEQWLPYQTMISSFLHQIAHKKIKLTFS